MPFVYGIIELEIEEASLKNGILTVNSCKGVLPDGSIICVPFGNFVHLTRSFESHFGYERQYLDVFIAVPLLSEGKCNVEREGSESNSNSRFISRLVSMTDDVHGAQKKEIEVSFYNMKMIFDDESLDNFTTLKICRLKRDEDGNVIIDKKFVPALLRISGSAYITDLLRNLIQLLYAKIDVLSQSKIRMENGLAKFAKDEEGVFRMFQTVSIYVPMLNYYCSSLSVHPFELYKYLMMFAGAISAFSADCSIRDFPKYDHNNIFNSLDRLVLMIKTILESDITTRCIQLPIEQINNTTFNCKINTQKSSEKIKIYMGAYSSIPVKELIIGILQRIKISSRERLEVLIASAMPGLQLVHIQNPPPGLSTKPGFVYFSLDQHSEIWKGIESSGSLAFHFPNNYPDLKIELLALREHI